MGAGIRGLGRMPAPNRYRCRARRFRYRAKRCDRMTKRAIALIALAITLAGCTTGQNQPGAVPAGSLTGVVTGPSGPVGGASIEVTAGDGSQQSAASTADGYFEIDRVPAGT